jgi:hypothetical protein
VTAAPPEHVPAFARGSRLFVPLCGLFLLTIFGVLYRVDPALYTRVLVWLIKEPFPHPFIDWEWIPSAVRCWQRGVDVYADNTCYEAIEHGRHGYSPLWLRMTFLPYGNEWLTPFGLGFAVLFFAALACLPGARSSGGLCVIALATFSPLTTFALERGNVDLLMFLLVIAGVSCWFGPTPRRLVGYSLFIVGGLLKFYPFVLLFLAVRERPLIFAGICAVTGAVLAGFGMIFSQELARIGANIPAGVPFDNVFAATSLSHGIAIILLPPAEQKLVGTAGMLLLTLVAAGYAIKIESRFSLANALDTMPRRDAGFLVAGSALVCGCFFAGQNVDYRAIMLLPTLPGLLFLASSLPERSGRALFAASAWTVVPLMWVFFIQQVITAAFGRRGMVAFAHWLLDQVLWWSIVTVLLAVLLGFFRRSEIGMLVMSRVGRRDRPSEDAPARS